MFYNSCHCVLLLVIKQLIDYLVDFGADMKKAVKKQNHSIPGRVFALHPTDLGSISRFPESYQEWFLHAELGKMPEHCWFSTITKPKTIKNTVKINKSIKAETVNLKYSLELLFQLKFLSLVMPWGLFTSY